MDEQTLRAVAQQLRKPEGEMGLEIGRRMNDGNAAMNRNAIAGLDLRANERVLEIGMGNGAFVKSICEAAPGIIYVGCDYAHTMVAAAVEMNAGLVASGGASFQIADASSLPFSDDSFEKVFAVNTIYFWERPSLQLAEISRVLVRGGKLIIGIRPAWCMDLLPFTPYGFTTYSEEALRSLLTAAGYAPEQVTAYDDLPQDFGGQSVRMAHLIMVAGKA